MAVCRAICLVAQTQPADTNRKGKNFSEFSRHPKLPLFSESRAIMGREKTPSPLLLFCPARRIMVKKWVFRKKKPLTL